MGQGFEQVQGCKQVKGHEWAHQPPSILPATKMMSMQAHLHPYLLVPFHPFTPLYVQWQIAEPYVHCQAFFITSNDRSFGCLIIYTYTIYYTIFFIDTSTMLDTCNKTHSVFGKPYLAIIASNVEDSFFVAFCSLWKHKYKLTVIKNFDIYFLSMSFVAY